MQKLGPPDTFYVSAAIGWLELGDPVEADRELCGVSAECVEHPDVLEVRWAIFAQTQRWPAALVTARALAEARAEPIFGVVASCVCVAPRARGRPATGVGGLAPGL